ncbi:MAG: hypothetical protein WCD63_24750, partial [Terrimicrobiaceae bacterium]
GLSGQTTASREFPLRLCGQPFARPSCVGERILVGDMDDWVVSLPLISLCGPSGCRQFAPFT